jgi:hypothetical protein
MSNPKELRDDQLEAEVARLAAFERGSAAALVAHLAELYGRRLHERAGFPSLFTYCLEALRFSEHEAYDRMKAAKVARRYPQVIAWLASGDLNLTTIRLLAPHLTRENHEGLFAAALGKRKRQVQELLAARFPKPDVAPSVRKLPTRFTALVPPATMPMAATVPGVAPAAAAAATPAAVTAAVSPLTRISAPPPPLVRPLAPDRYQVTFTADGQTRELLEFARDLLRHAIPDGDPARIIARALQTLVEDLVRQKFAIAGRPRGERTAAGDSRHIPADVKRTVYIRDRGRCTYVSPSGRRCDERGFLEFDHHPVPFAAGGRATVDNLVLRCRAHNQYLARRVFGERVGDDASRSGTTRRASGVGQHAGARRTGGPHTGEHHTGGAMRPADSSP